MVVAETPPSAASATRIPDPMRASTTPAFTGELAAVTHCASLPVSLVIGSSDGDAPEPTPAGAAGARYPTISSSTPAPMNDAARPGVLVAPRSMMNSLTITTAVHDAPATQAERLPVRAPATIPAAAMSVQTIDNEVWKAVESTMEGMCQGTSSQ